MNKEKLIVVIPAYEPPREFIDYARQVAAIADKLVVVNDGSGREYDGIFQQIQEIENAICLSYTENRGKGYALKMAFRFCVENYGGDSICVTADCDGQHSIEDLQRVAESAFAHPSAIVLGARDFDLHCVPKRSKMGNTSIRRIFKCLYGLDLTDTQTGLRGFSVALAQRFLSVKGDRFEFEMNMLIYAKKSDVPVCEVPIQTIYPNNPEDHVSHFKTIRDSLRVIGAVIRYPGRYVLSSSLAGILDILVFFILSSLVLGEVSAINTLIATVSARVASSLLNFCLNRKYVFAGKSRKSIFRYYTLWFCQLGASYGLVFLFGNILGLPMTPTKLIGDLILACFSYQIQNHWVFGNERAVGFYGAFGCWIRAVGRVFTKKYKSGVVIPEEPTVYICRHLNMHGPLTTLIRLDFHVHPMILSCFFDKEECYRQYADFTFTARAGKAKKKHNAKAYIASRIVPHVMKSLRGIPVYRGDDVRSTHTVREALAYLKCKESVIVYPDIDYTAGYESESDIYQGFLLLGQLYKRDTGKSLRFVPLFIDEGKKRITEYPYIAVDDFKERKAQANYIKASINGRSYEKK